MTVSDEAVSVAREILVDDAISRLRPMDSVCADFDVLTPDGVRQVLIYVGPPSPIRQRLAEIRRATLDGTVMGFVLGAAAAFIASAALGGVVL